jgi:hypothetical protein
VKGSSPPGPAPWLGGTDPCRTWEPGAMTLERALPDLPDRPGASSIAPCSTRGPGAVAEVASAVVVDDNG